MDPNPLHRLGVDRLPLAIAIKRHERLARKHTVAKAAEKDGQPTPPNIGNKFAKAVARNHGRTIEKWKGMRAEAKRREKAIIEAQPDEPLAFNPGATIRQVRMAVREAKLAKRKNLPVQSIQLSNGTHYTPKGTK